MSTSDLADILPRVIIVSRRSLRKNKFVDFVGEYHLDLIVGYGAVPVIVPRVAGVHTLLHSFEPIHGVLLCEGEDIDPSLYEDDEPNLSTEELEEIRKLHVSDTAIDKEKDTIELALAKHCLERNIPYLGICRGSQVLNVACGGTLYQDIGKELSKTCAPDRRVVHMDYENYDGHRHVVNIIEDTPLHQWFKESLYNNMEIKVNSYHHQGVKRLAQRFKPMAYAPDGLVEGFYDPDVYNPEEGKFIMGLQFHPERMRKANSDEFDYPGCTAAYKEFVKAVVAYQKKLNAIKRVPSSLKLDKELEQKRKVIVRSFSLARNLYEEGDNNNRQRKESDLKPGAEFLESNIALSMQQENRLKQMGATVRNASSYMERLKMNEEREKLARVVRPPVVGQINGRKNPLFAAYTAPLGENRGEKGGGRFSFFAWCVCVVGPAVSSVCVCYIYVYIYIFLLYIYIIIILYCGPKFSPLHHYTPKSNFAHFADWAPRGNFRPFFRPTTTHGLMGKMTVEQLSDLNLFYHMMGQICSDMLEKKQQLQTVTNGDLA